MGNITLKGSQYIPNDPLCKYGKMAVTVIDDETKKEKMYCGFLNSSGAVKEWWPIPTPQEVSKSLFEFIEDHS